jgi:hypothetical protein
MISSGEEWLIKTTDESSESTYTILAMAFWPESQISHVAYDIFLRTVGNLSS